MEDLVICILTAVCSSNIGFSDWFCYWVVCGNLEPDRQKYRRSWYFHSNILDSLMAWLAGVQLNPVFLFPPSQAVSESTVVSENTNLYGGKRKGAIW